MPGKLRGAGTDLRCGCGNLLARLVAGGVELKCRRCKRTVVLAIDPKTAVEVRLK